MKRRAFLGAATVGLLAAPLAAEAQQAGRVYKIGYLGGSSAVSARPGMAALRQYLQELGWVEGRNLAIEMRWADGKADRLPTLAGELVALGVDVIVTQGSPATRAAKSRQRFQSSCGTRRILMVKGSWLASPNLGATLPG